MSDASISHVSRRAFLGATVAGAVLKPLAPLLHAAAFTGAADAIGAGPGFSRLTRSEAALIDAIVNVLCPADDLTPSGGDCGLTAAIDRVLASDAGEMTEQFKAAMAAASRACRARFGCAFEQLPSLDRDRFVDAILAGDIVPGLDLSPERGVSRALVQACFSEPVYSGYANRVFWKMFSSAR